jgi:hypothetical protein
MASAAEQIKANQKWQYKFLQSKIDKLLEWSWKHGGNEYMEEFSLTCKTCNETCNLHTGEGAIQWLGQHDGHDTWVNTRTMSYNRETARYS